MIRIIDSVALKEETVVQNEFEIIPGCKQFGQSQEADYAVGFHGGLGERRTTGPSKPEGNRESRA